TLGRAAPVGAGYIIFQDPALQNPTDTSQPRIIGMRASNPQTGEPATSHGKGEFYFNYAPSTPLGPIGWHCNVNAEHPEHSFRSGTTTWSPLLRTFRRHPRVLVYGLS